SRLVALAALSLRGQKGRIGFRKYFFQRDFARNVAEMLHFRIGDVSCERNHESHIHSTPRFFKSSRKAVKNSAETRRPPVLVKDCEAVVPRVAAVDYDGQFRGSGLLELPPENLFLHIAGRMIVVIVEA